MHVMRKYNANLKGFAAFFVHNITYFYVTYAVGAYVIKDKIYSFNIRFSILSQLFTSVGNALHIFTSA